jgi:hypothetical protein
MRTATNELGLRLAVLRGYVATLGTLAAGVLWCYRDQQTALPLRFVFQLAAQLERAGIQDGTIQPRLLRRFLSGRSTHALDLQVFDTTTAWFLLMSFETLCRKSFLMLATLVCNWVIRA